MPKKVFELAKELDVKPLELVEDLKNFGFNVRNHMASLTDEEVQKFTKLREEKVLEAASKTKKVTKKKKVAKKKVATKKTTVKKTVAAGKEQEQVQEEEVKEKKTVKKKSSVIRRKASQKENTDDVQEEEITKEEIISEESSVRVGDEHQEFEELGPTLRGLKVVKNAPTPPPVEVAAENEQEQKEYLQEKAPHSFTPIYIPPKGEEKPKTPEKRARDGEKTVNVPLLPPDEEQLKKDSQKRLGGLAKMVAKPKSVVKARDITQIRADEELKSYAGISGRVLYRPRVRKRTFSGMANKTEITVTKESKRLVGIHGAIRAGELADKLKVKFQDFRDACLDLNLLVKEKDLIGLKLAQEMALLYDYRVEDRSFDEKKILEDAADKRELDPRNPIITIMGHVDHGKTTLLDYIRKAKVASGEAGGITQHIGAYNVVVKSGSTLTFLDTPGHAAFGAMRQRGAQVTDIVVLVVAADDGVMPQTKESVRFIQNAEVPLIVAINKMDKEGANPDRVKQELMEFNITPEEWGGDVQFIEISALKGDGVDNLLEAIALQAEMMELKADSKGKAKGVVIESKVESGRGAVATFLVQEGTLKKGDALVVGETFGRARSLMDSSGAMLVEAPPSCAVQVLGLQDPPAPGDDFYVVKSDREAKQIIDNRIKERLNLSQASKKKVSLEDFFASSNDLEKKTLRLIVRSDVQGSFEAIKNSVECLGNDEVGVEVIAGGVGAISDNDVNLASSSSAIVIGFNMRPVTSARRLSEQLGVEVRNYSIIYELINEVKLALEGLLEPESVEIYIGRAEVRNLFTVPKIGVIAGSAVIDGKIQRGCNIRLLRDGKIIFDGKMSSLKRFKDDAKEVGQGYECGIGLENFNDIRERDLFEAYMIEQHKRKLEQASTTQQANL